MTTTHPKREREAPELQAAITRLTRALVARAADGDTEALSCLAACDEIVAQAKSEAAAALHQPPWSYSWYMIGSELGITRQGAQQLAHRNHHDTGRRCEAQTRKGLCNDRLDGYGNCPSAAKHI